MKVPYSAVGNVKPATTGRSYLRPAVADTSAVTRALGGLGVEVSQLAERVSDRQDKTARFKVLRDFSQFELDANTAMTEMKRSAPPDGANFAEQADAAYTSLENEFIQKQVPPELQEEFRFRTGQVGQRVKADALSFQFTQQDSFFKAGVTEAYEKAKVGLAQSPDEYEAHATRLAEMINATELPAATKVELAKSMRAGLSAVVYGKKVEGIRRASPDVVGGTAVEIASNFLRPTEDLRLKPYWDENHWRVGYASDTITRTDGSVEETTQNSRVTEEEAELDLARRASLAGDTASGQVGADVWQSLPPNVQAGLLSVVYNYGNLPGSVVTAVKTGNVSEIAQVVQNLDHLPARRAQEAEIIRGGSGSALSALDNNPLFADIPLEDRIKMQNAADQRVTEEENEREKAQKEQEDLAKNELYTGLHDGKYTEVHIAAARNAGLLTDIDDIEKAEKILEDALEGNKGVAYINGLLSGNGVFNPSTDSEAYNKWLGAEGLKRVAGGDQDYINNVVVPAAQKLQDVPSDLIGQLTGMSRSNDPVQLRYAYENLALLEDTAPAGYAHRVSGDLAGRVDSYRDMRLSATDEELNNFLRGGRNPAEVQANVALDKAAAANLPDNIGNTIENNFDSLFSFQPSEGSYTASKVELEREFVSAFKLNYRATADANKAETAALRHIKRTWGVTQVGNPNTLMRYPPEQIYPAIGQDFTGFDPMSSEFNPFYGPGFSSYEDQLRRELNLLDDESFELRSDQQTKAEVEQYKLGSLNRLPSYSVVKFTVDGQPVPLPQRWFGDANAATQ